MKRANEKGMFLLMNKNLIEIFINHLDISYAEMKNEFPDDANIMT